jgi:TrpR-related protein YerC/YecD
MPSFGPARNRATLAVGPGLLPLPEDAAICLFYCIITLEQMAPKPNTTVTATRDRAKLTADLCEALLSPANPAEMANLLADLCTPAEERTLAERWHVARLLDASGLTYREIHEATGVSTTTIVRVARFLRQAPHHGYRTAIDRLGGGNVR